MNHFSTEQWTDFARRVTSSEATAAMQQHLDSGCKPCAETAQTMARVAAAAGNERAYTPEDGIVRIAKARFASGGRQGKAAHEFFPLIFDSFAAPAASGVRISLITTRQLLYRKDNCSIDIRLEHVPGNGDTILVGQILDSGQPGRDVGSIMVELLRAGKVLASTATTSFGEFQFMFAPGEPVELCFGVSSQRVFWIKVPPLDSIPEGGVVIKD